MTRQTLAASRFVVLLIAAPIVASAAPPEVTALFPAGGQQGTTVKVELQGKVDTEKLQLWCDQPGIELAGTEGKDAVQLKIAPDAAAGWCWLGFFNAEGAAAQRPFYIGTVPELNEDEPNNRLSEANKLASTPVVFNGVLRKSGDVDTVSLPVSAGQTLVASLTAKSCLDSPLDAALQIVDARGFILKHSDDVRGMDPQVTFTATTDGVYAVRVFGFPATPDSSIRFSGGATYIYRLTVTAGPAIDRVVPVAVTARQPGSVKIEGWNLPADSTVEVPASPVGIHSVSAPGAVSTAQVFASPWPVVVASEENRGAQPQAIELPGCVSGRLMSSGSDSGWKIEADGSTTAPFTRLTVPGSDHGWKFTAKKDDKLSLRATAKALGSPLDVTLRIVDAKGATLSDVDDAPQDIFDVVLDFTAPADGEYVAIVRDRFAHGGPQYGYALLIGPPEPDFVLSVVSDSITLTPEKDFELPVNVESRGGFDDEIRNQDRRSARRLLCRVGEDHAAGPDARRPAGPPPRECVICKFGEARHQDHQGGRLVGRNPRAGPFDERSAAGARRGRQAGECRSAAAASARGDCGETVT